MIKRNELDLNAVALTVIEVTDLSSTTAVVANATVVATATTAIKLTFSTNFYFTIVVASCYESITAASLLALAALAIASSSDCSLSLGTSVSSIITSASLGYLTQTTIVVLAAAVVTTTKCAAIS